MRKYKGYLVVLKHVCKFCEQRKVIKSPVLLVCSDGNRGFVYSDRKYSPLLDTINERLVEEGMHCLTIATPFSVDKGAKAFGNVVTINGLIARATIISILKYLLNRKSFYKNNPIVRKWEQVLKKINPQIIIAIQPSRELCIAANQSNIWVADLQHGILSDEGYYGWQYRNIFKQMGWPDCILCWDKGSANWVRDHLPEQVKTKVIGNPWILRFIQPQDNDKLLLSARKLKMKTNKVLTILVTLQWGKDPGVEYHETTIPLFLLDFIKECGRDYIWWLRIHPALIQGPIRRNIYLKFEQTFNQLDNVFWEECSEYPLPLILSQTDLHITSHGSTTVEASWFGIKTALLLNDSQLLLEYFKEQISNGYADIVDSDKESIRSWIEKNKSEALNPKFPNYMTADSFKMFIHDIKLYIRD